MNAIDFRAADEIESFILFLDGATERSEMSPFVLSSHFRAIRPTVRLSLSCVEDEQVQSRTTTTQTGIAGECLRILKSVGDLFNLEVADISCQQPGQSSTSP